MRGVGNTAIGTARCALVNINIFVGPGSKGSTARQTGVHRCCGVANMAISSFQNKVTRGDHIGNISGSIEQAIASFNPDVTTRLDLIYFQVVSLLPRAKEHLGSRSHRHGPRNIQVNVIALQDQDIGNGSGGGGWIQNNFRQRQRNTIFRIEAGTRQGKGGCSHSRHLVILPVRSGITGIAIQHKIHSSCKASPTAATASDRITAKADHSSEGCPGKEGNVNPLSRSQSYLLVGRKGYR